MSGLFCMQYEQVSEVNPIFNNVLTSDVESVLKGQIGIIAHQANVLAH